MTKVTKNGGTIKAASGKTGSTPASFQAKSSAVATLRASRTAKVASALSHANRKTGLFTKK